MAGSGAVVKIKLLSVLIKKSLFNFEQEIKAPSRPRDFPPVKILKSISLYGSILPVLDSPAPSLPYTPKACASSRIKIQLYIFLT